MRQLLLFAGLFCALPLVADIPAVDELRAQAEQGNADAQNELGVMYYRGRGVEQSYTEAVKWFRLSAEQGNAVAQSNLGMLYLDGEGVEQSDAEAVKWFRRSAEQGYAGAQNALSLMYYQGRGAEQSYAEAAEWWRRAAEQGYAAAQYNLGTAYRDGEGVEQSDTEAVKWLRRSAGQGHAGAQNVLGVMYYQGRGVEQSYTEAVKWFRLSAEQGNAVAQSNLGMLYLDGEGVEQSDAEAVKWFRRSAEQGNRSAITAFERMWERRLFEWRKVRNLARNFQGEEQEITEFADSLGITDDYAYDAVVRNIALGKNIFENEQNLRFLLRSRVVDRRGAEEQSGVLTEAFWVLVYNGKREFFVRERDKVPVFRGELFDEAGEANLNALAELLSRWYGECVNEEKNGKRDSDDPFVRVRVERRELLERFGWNGVDEPLMTYYIWYHPERLPVVLKALAETPNKALILRLFKEPDLKGTLPLKLAYEVSDNRLNLLTGICQVLEPEVMRSIPVGEGAWEEDLLAYAIAKRDSGLLELALKHSFSPDTVWDSDSGAAAGETALHRAVWCRWKEGVEILLDKGATNVARKDGTTVQQLLEYCLRVRPAGPGEHWGGLGFDERVEWQALECRIKNAKKGTQE